MANASYMSTLPDQYAQEWIHQCAARGVTVNGNPQQRITGRAAQTYKTPEAAKVKNRKRPTNLADLVSVQRRIITRRGADGFFVNPNPFMVR